MTTQHTVESLMALADVVRTGHVSGWVASDLQAAQQDLSKALTEVFDALAEAKQKMVDGVTIQQYIDMDNQVDALQSKCDELTQDRDEWKDSCIAANKNQQSADDRCFNMRAERDTLQSKCESQANRIRELEALHDKK